MKYKNVEAKRLTASLPFNASILESASHALDAVSERSYWLKYKVPVLVRELGTVNSVTFSPSSPFDYAVAASTRIQIYDGRTNNVRRAFSRFKDVVSSVRFRNDGKLLAAGDASGSIQLLDVNSRAVLRSLEGHERSVRVLEYFQDKAHLFSGSDDGSIRLWDLSTQQSVWQESDAHSDYVRAGAISHDGSLLLTGGYDHTIVAWDPRAKSAVMRLDHGGPVEALLLYPGNGVIASAGENHLKIWDILGGGRLLHDASHHQKTITSLAFDASQARLLTGSLDGLVKVYDVEDYKVVHSFKYSSPVLCMALSPNNDRQLVVGMANSFLSIREKEQAVKPTNMPSHDLKSYRFFVQGVGLEPAEDDFEVDRERIPKTKLHNKLIRKFRYADALNYSLQKQAAAVTVSVIEELMHRNGLRSAISDRDEVSLSLLVDFVVRHITRPSYSSTLLSLAHLILDMYAPVVTQSPSITQLVMKLKQKIGQEIAVSRDMASLLGMVEMLAS